MKECNFCLFNENNHPHIELDHTGKCDVCQVNEHRIRSLLYLRTEEKRNKSIQKIKDAKRGKYDCLIGISGGGDSTYLVHLAKEWGLNPLLLHIDGGWNSSVSVENIRNLVIATGFDYEAVVLDWKEMKEIQKAFVLSNVLDIDLPFDNAMLAYNLKIAKKHRIKYILNGYSVDTEGIMPDDFTHYKLDKRNIFAISKSFMGSYPKKIKFIGTFEHLYYERFKKIQFAYPLDWISYKKDEAKKIIQDLYGWNDYGAKHYDNVFTRFYQGFILPNKFGVDKRISHISMLICSGQLSKNEAMRKLDETAVYLSPELENQDRLFFLKKIGISEQSFQEYMQKEPVSHRSYKSDLDWYDRFRPIYRFIKRVFNFQFFR